MAVSAFSPPESRWMLVLRLPGGCAITWTPASRISSPVMMSFASPPARRRRPGFDREPRFLDFAQRRGSHFHRIARIGQRFLACDARFHRRVQGNAYRGNRIGGEFFRELHDFGIAALDLLVDDA